MKKKSRVAIFLFLIISLAVSSCKSKVPKKIFEGEMKIYPLSPYTTIHSDRNPVWVTKFLIAEGNIKDMVKTKDTVMAYINTHKDELICKKDTLTLFRIYEADIEFDHTYKETHPNPIGDYDRNLILSITYKQGSLYVLYYIIHNDSKYFTTSTTPPPIRE